MRTQFDFLRRAARFRFLILAIATVFLTAIPVRAAERLYVSYGLFERSVSVSSLEAYATDGTVNADLEFFLNFLDSDMQEELRKALNIGMN